jgi:hypothetical protein
VKEDLEGHLKRVNGLPGSQYGFCAGSRAGRLAVGSSKRPGCWPHGL